MREAVLNFLTLCHMALQSPGELSTGLERTPRRTPILGTVLLLSSLSTATGMFYIRDYYHSTFFAAIFFLTLVHIGIAVLWSVLLGCVIDALVSLRSAERAGKAWNTAGMLIMSTLPNIFLIAFAVPARLLRNPELLLVPAQLLLMVWAVWIAVQGIIYQYELTVRNAVLIYLRSLGIVLVFPFLFFLFITLELTGLMQ